MSDSKKLKIKGASGQSKKLIVKNNNTKALKIKKPLPSLNETPDPENESKAAPAPKGLKIKASSGEHSQAVQQNPASSGLKIKSTAAPQVQAKPAPKGLKIKASSGEHSQAAQQNPASSGLKIKSTAAPKPVPTAAPPSQQKVDLSQTMPPANRKSPPPMPTGYAPPPMQISNQSQAPVFPGQAQQAPVAFGNSTVNHEPVANPQGPIFPNNTAEDPLNATMAPAVHQKKTSAPLSAIMGEVKAAKRINPDGTAKKEVVKVKNPSITVKDSLENEFCYIKEGTYYVGMDNEIVNQEAAFTISKYPVTKEQYFTFLKEYDVDYAPEEFNTMNKVSPYSNCPAVMISWEDAKNYCRWLREKTGDYYALPSINEWEIAARGKDGRVYPWGDEETNSTVACFNDGLMEPLSTCSVDFFENNVSPFGCVGMIGNVMEWTLDSFDDERDPHILKGGGWVSPIDFCNNVTPCMSYPPTKRQEFVGFRLLFLPKELYQKYRETLLKNN